MNFVSLPEGNSFEASSTTDLCALLVGLQLEFHLHKQHMILNPWPVWRSHQSNSSKISGSIWIHAHCMERFV